MSDGESRMSWDESSLVAILRSKIRVDMDHFSNNNINFIIFPHIEEIKFELVQRDLIKRNVYCRKGVSRQ